jgi:hypothetical protein
MIMKVYSAPTGGGLYLVGDNGQPDAKVGVRSPQQRGHVAEEQRRETLKQVAGKSAHGLGSAPQAGWDDVEPSSGERCARCRNKEGCD